MFKDRLREARKNLDMTQLELAEKIGVVKSTVAGYETGRSEPDMEKFVAIMAALQVDANYLLADEMESQGGPLPASPEALALARLYDTLDSHGQAVVTAVARLESDR